LFKQIDDMSTAPMEFIWLEELSLTSLDKAIFAPLAIAFGNGDGSLLQRTDRPSLPPSAGRFFGRYRPTAARNATMRPQITCLA
jgi:hypothetical protein